MTQAEALRVAKPIFFNTEMVQAILSGTKTVTRRLIKPQPANKNDIIYKHDGCGKWFISPDDDNYLETEVKIPYKIGNILYVQETWAYRYCWECEQQGVENECDLESQKFKSAPFGERGCYKFRDEDDEPVDHQWHSAASMPKEAARIFLQVTRVRVERLQDIRLLEIIREGVHVLQKLKEYGYEMSEDDIGRLEYKRCWYSTIKKYGWEANPWVWVVEFEKLEVE